jgi:beta-alanine degradation protein BauB
MFEGTGTGKSNVITRFIFAVILGAAMTGVVFGQDPTKVEPKHYKLDFENERVQVVSVHYGPHEKSQMHEHPGGVVVVVTGGHLRFTDENGKVTEVFAKPGEARWFAPFKHTVENVGDTAYNAVYVGMKGGKNVISEGTENREILEAMARAMAASH